MRLLAVLIVLPFYLHPSGNYALLEPIHRLARAASDVHAVVMENGDQKIPFRRKEGEFAAPQSEHLVSAGSRSTERSDASILPFTLA
jgi:hypothetical protein